MLKCSEGGNTPLQGRQYGCVEATVAFNRLLMRPLPDVPEPGDCLLWGLVTRAAPGPSVPHPDHLSCNRMWWSSTWDSSTVHLLSIVYTCTERSCYVASVVLSNTAETPIYEQIAQQVRTRSRRAR